MKDADVRAQIVKIFRDNSGVFVSGEEVSEALGFSRASVWKYIQKLREDGYEIEAVPHLGYRLRSAPDRLFGFEVASGLKTRTIGKKDIYYFDSIPSTNDKACELAEGGSPDGSLVIAETQTSGRGRLGRKWLSPKAEGIYFSIILRPDVQMDEIPAITLIAAGAVIKAIKRQCGIEARMKWPNDVYINGRKVCGILTEIKAQPDRVDFLVLGMGINVNTSRKKLPAEGTSLEAETGARYDRVDLLKKILEEVEKDYTLFRAEGFESLREECKEFSSVLGKSLKIDQYDGSVEGVAVDIDSRGALILRTRSGEKRRIFSGDVVLCR